MVSGMPMRSPNNTVSMGFSEIKPNPFRYILQIEVGYLSDNNHTLNVDENKRGYVL
jgi:hypothetical protein